MNYSAEIRFISKLFAQLFYVFSHRHAVEYFRTTDIHHKMYPRSPTTIQTNNIFIVLSMCGFCAAAFKEISLFHIISLQFISFFTKKNAPLEKLSERIEKKFCFYDSFTYIFRSSGNNRIYIFRLHFTTPHSFSHSELFPSSPE